MNQDVAGSLRSRFDPGFLRQLEALSIVARRMSLGQARGERPSARVGGGIELADFRDYAAGDDLRFLDWSLYARLDRPIVRLREEREDLTVAVIVDGSASMGLGSAPKLDLAARVAAALTYVGYTNQDPVGLAVVGGAAGASARDLLAPKRGRGNALRMLDVLGSVTAAGATDLASGVRDVLAAAGPAGARRRGLAILLSDFFDPAGWRPALDRLRFARWEAIVLQITSPEDAVTDFDGELVIEDVETGDLRDIEVTPAIRKAYADRYATLKRELAAACRERQIPYFDVSSTTPFESVVLKLLRAGGILR